ncbi:hypothetical protein MRX96_032368 [Rhipicephalus microplus]
MPPDHALLLEDHARLLRFLLRDPPSDESWAQCEDAWTQSIALAVAAVSLPTVHPGRQRRQSDPSNAVDIQWLYRRNRRRAVRIILEGQPQTCATPLQDLQDHWGRMWLARQADSTLLLGRAASLAGGWSPKRTFPTELMVPGPWVDVLLPLFFWPLPRQLLYGSTSWRLAKPLRKEGWTLHSWGQALWLRKIRAAFDWAFKAEPTIPSMCCLF